MAGMYRFLDQYQLAPQEDPNYPNPKPPIPHLPSLGPSPKKTTTIKAKPVSKIMSKSRQSGGKHTDLNNDPVEIAKPKTMMTCHNPPRHPMEKSKEELYEDTREAGSSEDKTLIIELQLYN